jgi:hypothetical protein
MEYAKSNCSLMSEDVREVLWALATARRSFKSTGFSGTNAHQRYKYATLLDIYGAVEDALYDQKIAISQGAMAKDSIQILISRLTHCPSGQWIEDQRYMESEKDGNQAKGAAQTYMRKYAILALCGLCPDDDDGEEEEKHISTRQIYLDEIKRALKDCSNGSELYQNILKFNNIKSIDELSEAKYGIVMGYINKNKRT